MPVDEIIKFYHVNGISLVILVNGAHYFSDDYYIKCIFLFLRAVSHQLFTIQTSCQKFLIFYLTHKGLLW